MDEKIYTRVTDILSPFSGYDKIDADVVANAARRGTLVHEYIASMINGTSTQDDMPVMIRPYLDSFFKVWDEPEIVTVEQRFYDDKYMITGACDLIVNGVDGLTLIDWKTSSSVGKTWPMQASAYAYLARLHGYDIKKIIFIKLSKEGKAPKCCEYVEDFETFLHCYHVYNLFFKTNKKDFI